MPISPGSTVYRADMERKSAQEGENPLDSKPYIERLTVAKLVTIQRQDGSDEQWFSSVEYGAESGPVWYIQDLLRQIPYGYEIVENEVPAKIRAAKFYKDELGPDFTGEVEVRVHP